MSENRLQILISAVNKDAGKLPEMMNIESDAVIVNQIIGEDAKRELSFDGNRDEEMSFAGNRIEILVRDEKGVGLSRNTAFERADHELIQFGDDDIVYSEGYAERIIREFDAHPEADMLLFNVKAQEGRETYWNSDFAKVTWKNYGRYPAYAICARRQKVVDAKVRYSLLFGGGAPYMNGEDSLFLHDCLKAGLQIYRTTVEIGYERSGESTWFKGYSDKFFFDRGVLYHFLYGKMAGVLGVRYLLKNRNEMCREKGLLKSYKLLVDGVRHARTIRKQ
jgi:glycosyltransferase involved in cell wall biosynthesis